ncbi:MAG: hypothetical protein H6766_05485 [Candidatus Peribacteria bacterium]|nr:MAG: hypothetical protein H6766_05485 [Candidatus Peribacteria bacterium]
MTFWTLLGLGLLVFLVAPQIASVFVPGETEVIAESTHFVRIIALFLWAIGVQQIYVGMFR